VFVVLVPGGETGHITELHYFNFNFRNNMFPLIDVMLTKTLYRVCCSSSVRWNRSHYRARLL